MVVRRSRLVRAPVGRVWEVVADPHHLPRWWPRTARVEDVRKDRWTSVLTTDRGRQVRADYRVLESRTRARRRWTQQIDGTPFAKILQEATTEATLAAEGEDTRVTLAATQRPRGWTRFGGFMLRGAARRQLDEALTRLAAIVED